MTFFQDLEGSIGEYLDRVHNHYTRGGLGDYPANGGSSLDDDMIELGESLVWYFPEDRNEPLTGEWLESLGFSKSDPDKDFLYSELPDGSGWFICISIGETKAMTLAIEAMTRGQFRRLSAALELPLEFVD